MRISQRIRRSVLLPKDGGLGADGYFHSTFMSNSQLTTHFRAGILRRIASEAFLRVNEVAWKRVPQSVRRLRPVVRYGVFLNSLVKLRSNRNQVHGTFFLRNRPELELIRSLAERKLHGSTLKLTVLACSNGAEVYSHLLFIRSARPDLKLEAFAIDISAEIVKIASRGVYSLGENALVYERILARISEEEIASMFDREGDHVRVKPWIAEGVHWITGDAGDPQLAEGIGPADIVIANKFLCHMNPSDAEKCLRNLPRFVKPGGHLLVSGVDLEVRAKVAHDLGWMPVLDRIEEVHDGDPSVRRDWPWRYWGLEPFDDKRPDWPMRYAAIFQLGVPPEVREPVALQR